MRAFDPRAVGGLECRAWETYYRRRWLAFLLASARSFMRRFYRLLRVSEGATFDTTRAAQLEVEWWRAHRERQHDDSHLEHADELVGVGAARRGASLNGAAQQSEKRQRQGLAKVRLFGSRA